MRIYFFRKFIFIFFFIFICINSFSEENYSNLSIDSDNIEEEKIRELPLEERLKRPISIDLRNMDIIEALKYISTKGGINIVTTKNVGGRITVTLENVPLKDVFDLILRLNGLAYVKEGEIYQVMTEAEYRSFYGKNFFDTRQVKMLRLKYAIPDQAFSLLDALKSEIGRVLVDKESGSIMLLDTPEQIEIMEKALEEFEKRNVVEVFNLKFAKAKEVEDILKTRLDAKNVGSVKADERNNQVIVQAFPERMEEIRALINSLDKVTKEVLIDVKIVKIKLSDQLDKGVEWEGIFKIAKEYGATYLGSYPFSVITAGATTPSFTSRIDWYKENNEQIGSYPFSATTGNLAASQKTVLGEKLHIGLINPDRDLDLLINFLNTIGETRVLANPRIVVVNNQEARIHIGERQAYVTTTTTTGQTTSTIAEEVNFVDVGIQLSVTPVINDDGFIIMKIKPEVSGVSSILVTPTNNKIPIIDTTTTETTAMVKDNTTLLIGGLRKEDKLKNSKGLPKVSKLPFIGSVFQSGSNKVERTELLVMITPHIITGAEFVTGDEQRLEKKAGKEYKDYQPLPEDKALISKGEPYLSIKPYRSQIELKEERLEIKGER